MRVHEPTIIHLLYLFSDNILYSSKFWQAKTLAKLANCKSFANILPNQIYLYFCKIFDYQIKFCKFACTCMAINTIDNDILTWILFHHSYDLEWHRRALIDWRLQVPARDLHGWRKTNTATADWLRGTFR